jgi:membrane protein implicated in regulation of membrane protease activity
MAKVPYPMAPVTRWSDILKSFFAWSVIVESALIALTCNNDPLALLLIGLIVICFLVIFDALFPHERRIHGFTLIISIAAATVLSLIMFLTPVASYYLVLFLIILILIYFYQLFTRKGKVKEEKEHPESRHSEIKGKESKEEAEK